MAHALGVPREAMLLGSDREVPAAYEALVERRAMSEPLAYIVGHRAFWTIDLAVTPAVLIPRPDSETLIEAAVDHFGERGPETVLDLGTGSGALLLAALDQWPNARGLGIDRSEAALSIAAGNAARLGVADRAKFAQGDWAAEIDASHDLVLCNPPYVEADAILPQDVQGYEPHSALFAGADGLDDYRRIMPELSRLIAPGGMATIEIGSTQADAVMTLVRQQNLLAIKRCDLAGLDRCVVVTKANAPA